MNDILWRRLRYMLTPQFDLYANIGKLAQGKDVLDVGCGTGFGMLQFLPYAKRVVGLEPDPYAVAFARTAFPFLDVVEARVDGAELSVGTFDLIVMVEVLEHIGWWRMALANVRKLLKPGGQFVMTAKNSNADLHRNELHEREWTAQELASSLKEFFPEVKLCDYRLQPVPDDTHITPLIAVAHV